MCRGLQLGRTLVGTSARNAAGRSAGDPLTSAASASATTKLGGRLPAGVVTIWSPSPFAAFNRKHQGFDFVGGRTRARTLDPLIKSQLLYQLSYAPARLGSEVSLGPQRRGRDNKCVTACPASLRALDSTATALDRFLRARRANPSLSGARHEKAREDDDRLASLANSRRFSLRDQAATPDRRRRNIGREGER